MDAFLARKAAQDAAEKKTPSRTSSRIAAQRKVRQSSLFLSSDSEMPFSLRASRLTKKLALVIYYSAGHCIFSFPYQYIRVPSSIVS